MVDFVATGHSWSGGGGPITLTPLSGLLLTVVLARWFLGLRISPMLFGVSVFLGTPFALAADTWGLTTAIAGWVVAALVVAGRVRHTRGPLGRNPSD
jgi:hypothetical protein